jgi:2-polyprenyl-3-methyl-5-hydroxy-6-metoxy-1,4-benzoquinol methylase
MESIYESLVDPLRPNDAHGISLQLVGEGKNVLELGAAAGHVTKALKSLNNTVTAVERDGRFAEDLSKYADEVIITDLDWLDLRDHLTGKKFDVVLAGDVLEHCSKPELVLLQLHDLLLPDGYVVISLPNIAHGDVRLSLLAGNFDYRATGLLDRTHLRFFTRKSIEEFLIQNHYVVGEIFASTASMGTTEFGPPNSNIPVEAINYVQQDRDAMVYQYIVKAVPQLRHTTTELPEPSPRTDDARRDQLLAEVSLYQEVIAKNTELIQQESELVFRGLTEIDALRHELAQSHHEINIANLRVSELSQELVVCLETMAADKQKLTDFQLSYLDARDSAIGAAAELGEMRYQLAQAHHQIGSLVHQINLLHASRTWKIGRFILLPLRALRKALRLLMS